MARSHHRKKHKQHLQQFRQSHDTKVSKAVSKAKASATWIFTIAGVVLGFAVSYFATSGSLLWMAVGTVAGGAAGYLIGRKIDGEKTN